MLQNFDMYAAYINIKTRLLHECIKVTGVILWILSIVEFSLDKAW